MCVNTNTSSLFLYYYILVKYFLSNVSLQVLDDFNLNLIAKIYPTVLHVRVVS